MLLKMGCGLPWARNNRIMVADFLNQFCAFGARLESIVLGAHLQKIFFNSIDPEPTFNDETSGRRDRAEVDRI